MHEIETLAVTSIVAFVTIAWIAKSSLDDITSLAEKACDCYYRVKFHINRLRDGSIEIEEERVPLVAVKEPKEPKR